LNRERRGVRGGADEAAETLGRSCVSQHPGSGVALQEPRRARIEAGPHIDTPALQCRNSSRLRAYGNDLEGIGHDSMSPSYVVDKPARLRSEIGYSNQDAPKIRYAADTVRRHVRRHNNIARAAVQDSEGTNRTARAVMRTG
jgi:hypothetical protein